MIAGGVIGHYGVQLPMVEQGIALSVILMGLLVAAGVKLPVGPAMALVAVFAVFHGNAHGAEGIGAASFAGYAAGFVLATALLHAAGAVLGSLLERPGGTLSRNARRVVGGAGAVAGAAILLG
jgi:urease accessory protein